MKFDNENAIFRPNQDGLRKLLGDLESVIMELVWTLQHPVSVKEIHEILTKREGKHSYTTVMTVMGRLQDKGLLRVKEVKRRANIYEATISKEEFINKSMEIILDSLIQDFPNEVFKHFVHHEQQEKITKTQFQQIQERITHKRTQESNEQGES